MCSPEERIGRTSTLNPAGWAEWRSSLAPRDGDGIPRNAVLSARKLPRLLENRPKSRRQPGSALLAKEQNDRQRVFLPGTELKEKLLIDGDTLTVDEAYAVAVERLRVGLTPQARKRMLRTRAVVDAIVEKNQVVYGVTRGFGKLSDVAIPPNRLAELQINLVRSHASGVGDRLPEPEVRAMMLFRANVIAKG